VTIAERIEQGVMSGRISVSMEKKGFRGEKKRLITSKVVIRVKKIQLERYNTQSPSSHIPNINLNSLIPVRKPKPQNNQVKNQTKSFPKKNYQIT